MQHKHPYLSRVLSHATGTDIFLLEITWPEVGRIDFVFCPSLKGVNVGLLEGAVFNSTTTLFFRGHSARTDPTRYSDVIGAVSLKPFANTCRSQSLENVHLRPELIASTDMHLQVLDSLI